MYLNQFLHFSSYFSYFLLLLLGHVALFDSPPAELMWLNSAFVFFLTFSSSSCWMNWPFFSLFFLRSQFSFTALDGAVSSKSNSASYVCALMWFMCVHKCPSTVIFLKKKEKKILCISGQIKDIKDAGNLHLFLWAWCLGCFSDENYFFFSNSY